MSSSKRTRRAESDRGRSPVPGQNDHDLMTLFKQFSDTVIRKLDNRAAEKWPKEYEKYLACPFRRRNPARYANVLDCACTGYGFKDIADLRDHIKRVHSDRYGCSNCKERYQCRDKYLAEQERKHKEECKYAKKGRLEVSDFKPEWMTPGEDKRYFKLDFRRMVGLKVEDQYLKICEAIWPRFDSEGLNIWSKPGDAVAKCYLAELLEDPDLYTPFFIPLAKMAGTRRGVASSGRLDSRQEQFTDYYATEVAQPVMANNMHGGGFDTLSYPFDWPYPEDESTSTHNRLQQLNQIPQPTYYADNDKGPKDSGYWSSAQGDMDVGMDSSMSTMTFDSLNLPTTEYELLADLTTPAHLQGDVYMGDDLSLNELNLMV